MAQTTVLNLRRNAEGRCRVVGDLPETHEMTFDYLFGMSEQMVEGNLVLDSADGPVTYSVAPKDDKSVILTLVKASKKEKK